MGCICSKGAAEDPAEKGSNKLSSKLSNKFSRKFSSKLSSKLSRRFVAPSIREEVIAEADDGGSEGKGRLISTPQENLVNTTPLVFDEGEKKVVVERPRKTAAAHQRRATVDIGENGGELNFRIVNAPNVLEEERVAVGWPSRIVNVPNALEGEQVAAGWPSWLTAVAAEAIKGWVPRRADSFEKLDKIGQGTYSSVYKARDLETGKVVALKKVRFMNMDPESVRFMSREIHILRRLDHPNVVKLEGLITSRMSGSLYLVFEYMEHDLTGLAATPGIKFTEPQVKCYMHQLLHGLEHCNSRGVLHRDIKGSNLLIDNNGNLKIADFGLATFFHPDQKQPLTSRVVTLWYRPPELLLGATEYGCAVDLWSTGCILAELFAGKPIMPGRTEVEQLHKIFKLCGSPSDEYFKKSRLSHATIFKPTHPYKRRVVETFKDFPSSALALMNILLAIEPADRGTAASALKSEFFTMQPLACDPSSLPKYPPSKELDAKQRDEEARRQRARASKEYGEISAPDAHAELQPSVQKQHVLSNAKSNGEKYSPQEDNDFSVIPPKVRRNSISHSGPLLLHPDAIDSSRNKVKVDEIDNISVLAFHESTTQRSYMPQGSTDLSNLSGLVAARNNAKSDNRRERSTNPHWPEERMNGGYERLEAAERSGRKEWPHQLLDRPNSSQNKGARMGSRESSVGYGPKKKRIHYSGPLLPPGGNIDEMLKEHERQIQQAVRKARLDKVKSKKN